MYKLQNYITYEIYLFHLLNIIIKLINGRLYLRIANQERNSLNKSVKEDKFNAKRVSCFRLTTLPGRFTRLSLIRGGRIQS